MANVGADEIGIVKDLEEFGTELFIDRDGSGEIVGAAGFDFDGPLQRAFLYGPWSIDDEWDERATRLFHRVLAAAPATTQSMELAFDKENLRAARFGDKHGFELVRDHFTMGFSRGDRGLEPDPDIREMSDDERSEVMELHERCFEKTWPSGEQLIEQLGKGPDRRIFVIHVDGKLAGYHFATVERATGEAFVDNLGVDQAIRGRGLATRLLTHGLWWMFSFEEVEEIELSVRQENAAALRVYENAGFRKLWAIRQMRMPLPKRP
jgi:ribosomal protein S18 acetylase RimI-like enzyme